MKRLIMLSLLAVLSACEPPQVEAPVHQLVQVKRGSIQIVVTSAGIVEPLATVEVKSEASGEVLDVLVATGDAVEKGALMVQIDPRMVKNRLAQAAAELEAARSQQLISESQMKRAESLARKGSYTETEYERAVLEQANAEAQAVRARVAVENARIAVDDTDVRAPMSGTVIEKSVEKGQVISSPTQDIGQGTLLLRMADLGAVQIRSLVDETDVGKLTPGLSARITVSAYPNREFPGTVQRILPYPVVDSNVTMFPVLISIANPDGLLLPGMNAEVTIPVARVTDVLTVPVMALRTERDFHATAGLLGVAESELHESLAANSETVLQADSATGSEAKQYVAAADDSKTHSNDRQADFALGGNFWVLIANGPGAHDAVPVQTGISDLENVEISRGLEDGDSVLLLPSAHLVETQARLQDYVIRRGGAISASKARQ